MEISDLKIKGRTNTLFITWVILQHEFCFLITSFAATNCSLIEFKNKRISWTMKSPNVFDELDPFQLAAGIFACHNL